MSISTGNFFKTLICVLSLCFLQVSFGRAAETASLDGRYFMVVWAYQGPDDDLVHAHTFISFYRGNDLAKGVVSPLTISWLPATKKVQPFGSERGHNFSLAETLQMACHAGRRVQSWGPYEITAELFERAKTRLALLQSGRVSYSMINSLPRSMNCITAAGDITSMPLDTGILWGVAASAKVVKHLSPYIVGKEDDLKDLVARSKTEACPGRATELSRGTINKSIPQSIAAALGH